jgi:hypothetical protein
MRTGTGDGEMARCDALAIPEINRFKEDVNTAFRQTGKTAIDFGSGLWQRIWRFAILAMNTRILESAFRTRSRQDQTLAERPNIFEKL